MDEELLFISIYGQLNYRWFSQTSMLFPESSTLYVSINRSFLSLENKKIYMKKEKTGWRVFISLLFIF